MCGGVPMHFEAVFFATIKSFSRPENCGRDIYYIQEHLFLQSTCLGEEIENEMEIPAMQ